MLPRIQELFDAFNKFNTASQRSKSTIEWNEAREQLKHDLDTFGIADHFDWSLE